MMRGICGELPHSCFVVKPSFFFNKINQTQPHGSSPSSCYNRFLNPSAGIIAVVLAPSVAGISLSFILLLICAVWLWFFSLLCVVFRCSSLASCCRSFCSFPSPLHRSCCRRCTVSILAPSLLLYVVIVVEFSKF
ncbi:hypothetical protein BVRB_9g213640 [Beta vulgaris subsp. vulgaris]|nr:hypothetical protein BVRB_9g213640 [Beta vulgaris subsp. vulgaris]